MISKNYEFGFECGGEISFFLEALRIPVINISSYVFSKGVLGKPIVGSLKFQNLREVHQQV